MSAERKICARELASRAADDVSVLLTFGTNGLFQPGRLALIASRLPLGAGLWMTLRRST